MTASWRLVLVRSAHTAIYGVMVLAIFTLLYAGVTGASGLWLRIAAGLVIAECVVFAGAGMKCPLTGLVAHYADPAANVSDTYLPERWTRHTLVVFGPIMMLAFGLLAWRWLYG